MPVETDGVTDAARKHFGARTVRLHPRDRSETFVLACAVADVAGGANGNIEKAVRSEPEVFPSVVARRRKLVIDARGLRRCVQLRLDSVIARDATDFRHVECAIPERDAARLIEVGGDSVDLVGSVVAVLINNRVNVSRSTAAHK